MINVRNKNNMTVVVGMSGGVDSSVVALLLLEQGYNVVGLHMKGENIDTRDSDERRVRELCKQLGQPLYCNILSGVVIHSLPHFKHLNRIFSLHPLYSSNGKILSNIPLSFKSKINCILVFFLFSIAHFLHNLFCNKCVGAVFHS